MNKSQKLERFIDFSIAIKLRLLACAVLNSLPIHTPEATSDRNLQSTNFQLLIRVCFKTRATVTKNNYRVER